MPKNQIFVIGGGRWARVIIRTLFRIGNFRIYVHSPNNWKNINNWSKKLNLANVRILKKIKLSYKIKPNAAIVVNKANEHFFVSKKLISLGIPTIIEKPITANLAELKYLENLSIKKNISIAPGLVFLFSGYLKELSSYIASKEKINEIKIIWSDPINEIKDGEPKIYDPNISVLEDCLPHFLSIISLFLKCDKIKYDKISFFKGGSSITAYFKIESKRVVFKVSRNSDERRRIILVKTSSPNYEINFSDELPTLKKNNRFIKFLYKKKHRRPMEQMLRLFLSPMNHIQDHKQFNLKLSKLILRVTKLSMKDYIKLQKKWIKKSLESKYKNNKIIKSTRLGIN